MANSFEKQESFLNRFLKRIPGFGGYVEQEARQASEQQTRNFVIAELQKTKSAIDRHAKALVEAALIDDAPKCEKLRDTVDTMGNKLKSQLPGHSSFYGASRIDDDALEDIYDCDVTLMDYAEDLSNLADQLGEINDSSAQLLSDVGKKIDELKQQIADRDRMLSEFK